jgi:hypothetical protein
MSRLIITLVTPKYRELHELTYPNLVKYAVKCDAVLRVIEVVDYDTVPPHFEKYALLEEAQQSMANRILYIDADVYVRDDAPNVFKVFDGNAMFNESVHNWPNIVNHSLNWIEQELGPVDRGQYYNTGVMLFRRKDLVTLTNALRHITFKCGPCFEQDQLNYEIQKAGIVIEGMPRPWNTFCDPHYFGTERMLEAYFLHGNCVRGVKEKLTLLRKFVEAYP